MGGITFTKFYNKDGHGYADQCKGFLKREVTAQESQKITLQAKPEDEVNDITDFGSKHIKTFKKVGNFLSGNEFTPVEIDLGERFGFPQFYRETQDPNVKELVTPKLLRTENGLKYADIDGDNKADFIFKGGI